MNTSKTIIFFLLSTIIIRAQFGEWMSVNPMNTPRQNHALVILPNGNVLVSGSSINDTIQSNTSCEIFDINTNIWRPTTPMNKPKYGHHMALLDNGDVFAFGGRHGRSCEIFNPITEDWRITDSIPTGRNFGGEAVTKLADGRFMVIGGRHWFRDGNPTVILNNCDIYDPITEKWTVASPMLRVRERHTATLLNDGNVLVSGGNNRVDKYIKNCEIYDPISNSWSNTASLNIKRDNHASILLNDGSVFVSGGNSDTTTQILCEVFDVYSNTWRVVGATGGYRSEHAVYYLNSNNILLLIGNGAGNIENPNWEIYDVKEFEPLYTENFPSQIEIGKNSIQLFDGRVLIAGGVEFDVSGSMPMKWPTSKAFIFDLATDIDRVLKPVNKFQLDQNYPNPFNPGTTIQYSLQKSGNVGLKIYNTLGEEILTLINEYQVPGHYSYKFHNSANKILASGIYIYKLKVGEFIKSRKMVLTK